MTKFPGSGGRTRTTSAIGGDFQGLFRTNRAISNHHSVSTRDSLDFGDTAVTHSEITADMRHTGGYYMLARAGQFTIWASQAPGRLSGRSRAAHD